MVQAAFQSLAVSRQTVVPTKVVAAPTSLIELTQGERTPAVNADVERRVDEACRALSPLLRKVAYRFARRLPSHVEVEELISAGAVGLVTAVRQHYDKPQVELKRLAVRRIHGAMLDHLRAADHLTRRQRAAVGAVQRAKTALENKGEGADMHAVAKRLGISVRRAEQIQDRLMAVQVTPLSNPEALADNNMDITTALADQESKMQVVQALTALPERLRTLLSLYYYEELTYQEISEILGISRSRICQLHTQAIVALRRSLAKTMGE